MNSIKEILASYKIFGGVSVEKLMILNHIWKEDLKKYSSFCDIYSIEKKTLILKVKNPVLKNDLYMKKDFIIKEINSFFKSKFIKDIKFI
ncbi:MAG: DUF721 domain-containing protein [Elusimicrobiota bacterium]